MRQFILIDHSLQDLGGHHFQYAHSVLAAAAAAGFAPVVGTHRRFRDTQVFDAGWRLLPLFDRDTYTRYSLDKQSLKRRYRFDRPATPWSRLRRLLGRRVRARIAQEFARGCARLFTQVELRPGDQIFVATMSELDLAGLAACLRSRAVPAGVVWHLQFHFGIFEGRDPQHAAQHAAASAMRQSLLESLAALAGQELHFYCTTDALTRQYQSLGVAPFATLPYPAHPVFSRQHALRPDPQPVRIACLGHARREKGYDVLPALLRELRVAYLETGRARMVLQSSRSRDRRALQSLAHAACAIEFVPGGLDLERYAELVRSTDVGLLPYSGERYYDRCSGVLLELLVAGVPVVVPAGSWLSEQVDPANQSWLAELQAMAAARGRLRNLPISGVRELQLDVGSAPRCIPLQLHGEGSTLLLQFDWRLPQAPGNYLRVELEQQVPGATLRAVAIAGHCPGRNVVRLALRLRAVAGDACLRLQPAWQSASLQLGELQVSEIIGPPEPLNGVGVCFATPDEAPAAVREILEHLAHYKRRAAAHATVCAQHYSARQVIAHLTGVGQGRQ